MCTCLIMCSPASKIQYCCVVARHRLDSGQTSPVPENIDHVFAKTSQNARFLLSENERFGLVFVKTGSINSGTVILVLTIFDEYIHRSKDGG